ncbi:GTP 3',8-cyclase MoaA [Betaproteobacteria bacterium]|nr:GTP 3',8-cyclase MoaA [Betaproteobacteria bacterium]
MNNRILRDSFDRKLTDLRISLTDQCNFRCSYCMPKEIFGKDYQFLLKKELLSFEEIKLLSDAFINLGVEKLRLTGGEPLLRKNLPELIYELKALKTLKGENVEVTLTTNGFLLQQFTSSLKKSGLDRVTVSLDALDENIFQQMIGRKHSPKIVLSGIDAAIKEGLSVKVNMVVKKGVNHNQIIPMADYFKKRSIQLRFIEFMDVGNSNQWNSKHVLPSLEIIKLLHKKFGVTKKVRKTASEVAEVWSYSEGGTFGTISSVSKPFCKNCSRVRLSSDGLLYTCLFSSTGYNLKKFIRDAKFAQSDKESVKTKRLLVENFVQQIWARRSDRYSEQRLTGNSITSGQKIEMSYIGG